MTLEEMIVKRDELLTKIASGTKSLRTGETAMENQDIANLLKALSALNDLIATEEGTTTRPRRTVASYSSGLR